MYTIHFTANGKMISVDEIENFASDTIRQVDCTFTLSNEWSEFDFVKAVFFNKAVGEYEMEVYGSEPVVMPWEVLTEKGKVRCNLVGCTVSGEGENVTVTERLTTFMIDCLNVKQKINLAGLNTVTPTSSAFEQFVARTKKYRDEAENAKIAAEETVKGFDKRAEQAKAEVSEITINYLKENEERLRINNVYIGDDEPTNPDIKVWIKSNGEPDDLVTEDKVRDIARTEIDAKLGVIENGSF